MRMTRSAWWKLFGLAGVVGVVATGAVIARGERRRRAYTPEEIRTRLRSRAAEAAGGSGADIPAG
jgi:hypothetical protein